MRRPCFMAGLITEFDASELIDLVTRDLWAIARGRTRDLSYEEVYRSQFNLVIYGHGATVHVLIQELLRHMSRCMPKKKYDDAVKLIYQVSMHLDNKWCVVNEQLGVHEMAIAAYIRPVAQRWRRALAMTRWRCRLAKWRTAFNEVWLRPGGVGERRLAENFENYARPHTHA